MVQKEIGRSLADDSEQLAGCRARTHASKAGVPGEFRIFQVFSISRSFMPGARRSTGGSSVLIEILVGGLLRIGIAILKT
ncbi:MAG TPA: hypothetical protein VIX19_12815 [Terriglobales bacterium]